VSAFADVDNVPNSNISRDDVVHGASANESMNVQRRFRFRLESPVASRATSISALERRASLGGARGYPRFRDI
jgi:hypothetical protein